MPHFDEPSPLDPELEQDLSALRPARAEWDRDQILRLAFRAGAARAREQAYQASRRQVHLWRGAAAVLALATGAGFLRSAQTVQVERVVYVDRNVPATTTSSPTPPPTVVPTDVKTSDAPAPLAWSDALGPPNKPLVPGAGADYLAVREAVLRWGVRVVPASPAGDGGVASPAMPTVQSLLGLPKAPPERPAPLPLEKLKGLLFLGDRT